MRFLDYANKVKLTSSDQLFAKDGVAFIGVNSTVYIQLLIEDTALGYYYRNSNANPHNSSFFPVKAGQRVRVNQTHNDAIAYFIPFLD